MRSQPIKVPTQMKDPSSVNHLDGFEPLSTLFKELDCQNIRNDLFVPLRAQ